MQVDYGIYDCHSEHWNQVFEQHPTSDDLVATYMDSSANFLQTGLYMFCSDIRSEDQVWVDFRFSPGFAYGESEKCMQTNEVVTLEKSLSTY